MLKEFIIANGIVICTKDAEFNIFNIYSLTELNYNVVKNSFRLEFNMKYVQEFRNDPPRFYVEFLEVEHLEINIDPNLEKDVLVDEIGYKDRDDNDFDWLKQEAHQSATDDLIVRLSKSGFVRINSRRAVVVIL